MLNPKVKRKMAKLYIAAKMRAQNDNTSNWNKEFLTDQEEDALPKPKQNWSGKDIMKHYKEVPLAKLKDYEQDFCQAAAAAGTQQFDLALHGADKGQPQKKPACSQVDRCTLNKLCHTNQAARRLRDKVGRLDAVQLANIPSGQQQRKKPLHADMSEENGMVAELGPVWFCDTIMGDERMSIEDDIPPIIDLTSIPLVDISDSTDED